MEKYFTLDLSLSPEIPSRFQFPLPVLSFSIPPPDPSIPTLNYPQSKLMSVDETDLS